MLSPLHLACYCGHVFVVRTLLLEYKADLNARDESGATPFLKAALGGNSVLVQLMIINFNQDPLSATDGSSNTPLHMACLAGREELARLLITKYNCPVDVVNKNNHTPLHIACCNGHFPIVKMLVIEFKANLMARNHQNDTPIHKAALKGHEDTVQVLITELGCNPQIKGFQGRSLLHQACDKGHTKLAMILITNFGLDPLSVDDNGNTPLHMACWGGHEELARLLITKYHCPVDVVNKNNRTPLHNACMVGHSPILKMLVTEFNANLMARDQENDTPINKAALKGCEDTVQMLITELGCSPQIKGFDGRSLLHQACGKGHTKLAMILITNFGLDPLSVDDNGNTPLHMACWGDHEELARLLITKYHCPVDVVNKNNRTPLHNACMVGHSPVIKMLVTEFKANLMARDNENDTPINIAALNGHEDTVQVLITELGCSPQTKGVLGMSLLHQACFNRHTKLAMILITDFGLDPLSVDDNGNTPLHMACMGGHEELARLLITKYNCPVDVVNKKNRTPFHIACLVGHSPIVKMLVTEFKANLMARDHENDTPINKAALNGHEDTVRVLITELGCSPQTRGFLGRSLLHQTCSKGHTKLAKLLITDYGLDPLSVDDNSNTPLHMACLGGHKELARLLITKCDCPIDVKNVDKQTPLHITCSRGHLDISKLLLVSEYMLHSSKRLYNALDKDDNTPLDLLIKRRDTKAVHILSTEYGLKSHVRGVESKPLLHQLAAGGFKIVLQELISNFNYDPACSDEDGNTILHTAAQHGRYEIAVLLITNYSNQCPVDNRNCQGLTALHNACMYGHARMVKLVASKALGDKDEKAFVDDSGNTLLHIAALHGQYEIAKFLIADYSNHCPIDHKNYRGQTALHCACIGGHTRVAKFLVANKADITVRDEDGDTPLKKAFLTGHQLTLFELFDCNLHTISDKLLQQVCERGSVDMIDVLLSDFHLDPSSVLDDEGNKAIHIAALQGHKQVIDLLVKKYNCPIDSRGFNKWSSLHHALAMGDTSTAKTLIEDFHLSLHCVDEDGNTPLHLSSLFGHSESVRVLLYEYHAPVYVRNKAGKTALDLATEDSTKKVIRKYTNSEHKRIQDEYEELRAKSLQKYSGQQVITRVFVVGNPGSGKSTLVESLKRKGIFSSLFSVTEADVPPHTAGIVPSVHQSKETGRLLYYDFAGDQEYYSSHAAILEMVSRSTVGSNIFLIVADLTKDDAILQDEIGYWLYFISYHGKTLNSQCKLKVIIVLSHSDRLSVTDSDSKVESARQFLCTHINQCIEVKFDAEIVSSNCRSPRSSRSIASILQQMSNDTPPCSFSYEASLLHGLLEKDFGNVVACNFQNLLSSVEETGIYLPSSADILHPIVRELHDIGLLMLIGRSEDELENYLLLLNPSSLTNDVHEKLFSISAIKKLESSIGPHFANMGILPESYLTKLLPEHITKECLVQLQYCQEFSHAEVGLDYSVTSNDTSDYNLLYFPALCKLDSKKRTWSNDPRFTFGIGWYAECREKFDYLPARFLHVLLLRLAYAFALPIVNRNPTNSTNEVSAYSRRCTMWKNGIHWRMEEGVEYIVEVVNDNKGIAVITKYKENSEKWATVLGKIIDKAMQAKAEFCNAVSLHHFVLKSESVDTANYSDPENLFDISDIERVIRQLNSDSESDLEEVLSADRRGSNSLDLCILHILKRHSCWGRLHDVKHCITK